MTKDEFYKQQSKEQLIIFLKNQDYEIQRLRDKLFLLTGCQGFGNSDGMDGGCVDCYFNNRNSWERCNFFQSAFHEYRKQKQENKI